jgi:hypothetical protein
MTNGYDSVVDKKGSLRLGSTRRGSMYATSETLSGCPPTPFSAQQRNLAGYDSVYTERRWVPFGQTREGKIYGRKKSLSRLEGRSATILCLCVVVFPQPRKAISQ